MPDLTTCPYCHTPLAPLTIVCPACGGALTLNDQAPVFASRGALENGALLNAGRYVVENLLGQGGFGITYLARDLTLSRPVAIKELFPTGSGRQGVRVTSPPNWTAADLREANDRFLSEGRNLARFNNRGIVHVLEVFAQNSTSYIVMEALEGETLGARLERRRRLPPDEAADIAKQVASALELIHAAVLLHRDIKPDNIFLTTDGRAVLLDFGSARQFVPGKSVQHTRILSPQYSPLEQFGGQMNFGPPTDLYALGATLYHALTGVLPTGATDRAQGIAVSPLPRTIPAGLRQAVEACLQMKITDRPANARAFQNILEGRRSETRAPSMLDSPAPAPQPETYLLQFGGGFVTDRRLQVGGADYSLRDYLRVKSQPARVKVAVKRRASFGSALVSAFVTYLIASVLLASSEAGAIMAFGIAVVVFFTTLSGGNKQRFERHRSNRILLYGHGGWQVVYETLSAGEASALVQAISRGLTLASRS